MAYIDLVKPWFETGDKPTQQQFWTLFSYLWFKDQLIDISAVNGLTEILNSKASQSSVDALSGGELILLNADGYYDIAAGYLLEKFIVVPAADILLTIGNVSGTDDIAPEQTIDTNGAVYVVNIYAKATKRIFFNGITSATQIVFFKRKVTLAS